MRILMINVQGTGVGWFRHWLPAAALRARGHEVIDFPHSENCLATIDTETDGRLEPWLMNVMGKVDVVHMGYTTSESIIKMMACAREYAAKALGRNVPLITDIDDDILHVPTYNAAFGAYHGGSEARKLAKMQLQISDAVTVSTAPLGEALTKLCKKQFVLPNCFQPADFAGYPSDPRREEDESVRVMFAGGRSRIGDIETLSEPLARLMEKHPQLRLLFFGSPPKWVGEYMPSKSDPAANRAFIVQGSALPTYWAAIKYLAPDIIINPLETNDFNKSKSCIKAYDAILAGAAYVGTDYPTHDPIPEEAMYKCVSPMQWEETLSYLIENKAARKKKALALKEWGLANATIEAHICKWESAYEDCISRPVVRSLEDTA